jgi:hypothetical protein
MKWRMVMNGKLTPTSYTKPIIAFIERPIYSLSIKSINIHDTRNIKVKSVAQLV